MPFIRPEVSARFRHLLTRRWPELAMVAVLGTLGLAGIRKGIAQQDWEPAVMGLVVIALAVAGWIGSGRMARLSGTGEGAGYVEVFEGRVGYFGPKAGGFASRDLLTRVEIVTTDAGPFASDVFWVLWQDDAPPLTIPSDARGAAALIDLLSTLSGARMEVAIAAMGSTEPARFVVWSRDGYGGAAAQPSGSLPAPGGDVNSHRT